MATNLRMHPRNDKRWQNHILPLNWTIKCMKLDKDLLLPPQTAQQQQQQRLIRLLVMFRLFFHQHFSATRLTWFHLNKCWNLAVMVMAQQPLDCLLLWQRDYWLRGSGSDFTNVHILSHQVPSSSADALFLHYTSKVFWDRTQSCVAMHALPVFHLLSSAGLLESSMRLKPHEAQSYRKKALWVSWVSIAVTIILAIVAFSECLLSWVLCLPRDVFWERNVKQSRKVLQAVAWTSSQRTGLFITVALADQRDGEAASVCRLIRSEGSVGPPAAWFYGSVSTS